MRPAVQKMELNRKLLGCIEQHCLLALITPVPSKAINTEHAPLAWCCDKGFLVARQTGNEDQTLALLKS
jgi:hypothetical protein